MVGETPKNVYNYHKVCERHFEKKQLREVAYPGSSQRLVVGACPTLFLNEEIGRRSEDIPHIRWDHTYSRIEDNTQNEPTTIAELDMCARRER